MRRWLWHPIQHHLQQQQQQQEEEEEEVAQRRRLHLITTISITATSPKSSTWPTAAASLKMVLAPFPSSRSTMSSNPFG